MTREHGYEPYGVETSAAAAEQAREVVKELVATLETEAVAYDIGSYRDAPPGLRLWGGATVEREDLELLFPWLDWAWSEVGRRT